MNRIVIATHNSGKLKEFQFLLGDKFVCLSPQSPELFKIPAPADVPETGSTYRENALLKAEAYVGCYGLPVLSDDSGLEVECLGGAPGLYSARLGGEKLPWPDRWALLHSQMKDCPPDEWNAQFRCVLCFLEKTGATPQYFEGIAPGKILPTPRGAKGFGYDPIFYSTELKKGFGEATDAEKNEASHRAKALRAFLSRYNPS